MNKVLRHFNFIFSILKIHVKALQEYKTNFYTVSIVNVAFFLSYLLGYVILKAEFEDIFYWSFNEFLFSLLFLEYFLYIFHPWFRRLPEMLLSGDFNMYLVKPINIFVNYMFSTVRMFVILFSFVIGFFLFLYLILLLSKIYFLKLLICFAFAILGGVFYISTICLIDSLAFFMKQNKFLQRIHEDSNNFFSSYPISFFKESPIFLVSYFLGYSYFSFYITDYYFGYIDIGELFGLLKILLLLIFVIWMTIYFLWKMGIKRYEAFG